MRVRFIGSDDPTEDTICTVFGMDFPKGEWVEVENQKLATNPAFEVDADQDDEPDDIEAIKEELTLRGIKFHHKAGPDKLKALLNGNL